MKTVTPEQLREAYESLYPEEGKWGGVSVFDEWLWHYEQNPVSAISTCVYRGRLRSNWKGKVTAALFEALRIPKPKTKRQMLEALA